MTAEHGGRKHTRGQRATEPAADAEGDNTMTAPVSDHYSAPRRSALAATVVALVASVTGCAGTRAPGDEPAPTGQALVIGASLELTGQGSALGTQQEHALRILAAKLDVDGVPVGRTRRPVRLELRDNQSDPTLAARQAGELAGDEGIQALVGGTLPETALALEGVARKRKIPFLSLAPGAAVTGSPDDEGYVFKLTPDDADVARRLAEAVAAQKLRRVAVLAAQGSHGDAGAEALPTALKAAGVRLDRTGRLPATGSDFRAAVRRVATGRPDAVLVWATAPDSGAAAKELRRSGYRGRSSSTAARSPSRRCGAPRRPLWRVPTRCTRCR
ncbi:hypothetical protein GCM10027605_65170 [Micromonospora zhanjiangensis]